MTSEDQSQISENDLRRELGDAYSEDVLSTLRAAEAAFQTARVDLSAKVTAAKISVSEYALKVNRLFDEFLEQAASTIGADPCRSLFDAAPGDGFELIDIEESVREDTRRLQYADKAYAALYPHSVDRVVTVTNFVESLRAAGIETYAPLTALLRAIEAAALEFLGEGRNHEAWFVLIEAKDSHDPFFGFVQTMYNYGYTLKYASEAEDVGAEIEKLKESLAKHPATKNAEAVNDRVRFVRLRPSPGVTNLCFLKREPDAVPIGFWTIRAHGTTVGGWSMSREDAKIQWKDLLDFVSLSTSLKLSDAS